MVAMGIASNGHRQYRDDLVGFVRDVLGEVPKWEVRAGKVVRIQDLVPPSVSSPAFDDLRTFYIVGTEYDALSDTLRVQPDRPRRHHLLAVG